MHVVIPGHGTGIHDRALQRLVARLREASPDFARTWDSHPVSFQQTGTRELVHPVAGRLALDFQALAPIDHPGLRLIVYTCEEGSATADGLARLAAG